MNGTRIAKCGRNHFGLVTSSQVSNSIQTFKKINLNICRMATNRAANRIKTFDPSGTVFAEFTALANKHKAINLGQGFPAFAAPDFVDKALKDVANDASNIAYKKDPKNTPLNLLHQYTRSEGHPRFVNALAKYYKGQFGPNIELDPLTNIVTTTGASEALSSTILAFVNPGDKVVLIQPFYDSYPAAVSIAGGKSILVSLEISEDKVGKSNLTADDYKLDFTALDKACGEDGVKLLILNNPNNPLGKVYSREELLKISEIAIKHDILVLSDEVYETLVFSDAVNPMIKFGSLPGMWERTITVGSIGKMLGITGWKLGWVTGPKDLIRDVWLVHQFIPFVANTPLQEAAGRALEAVFEDIEKNGEENGFFHKTRKQYEELRDDMQIMLEEVNLSPIKPHGGYFTIANISNIPEPKGELYEHEFRDYRICKSLTIDGGVTTIPLSPFYLNKEDKIKQASNSLRFAFCKDPKFISDAGIALKSYFEKLNK